MAIYASTPRTASVENRRGKYLAAGTGFGRVHSPNRVLVRYRAFERPIPVVLFIKGWWYPDLLGGWADARFSEREHAYRVLSRWIAIYGDDS